jgi:hypothetical protein
MANYAIIENGVVVNTAEATPEFAAQQGWTDLPLGYQIGDEFDGTNWKSNTVVLTVEQLKAQAIEQKAAGVRAQRNALLTETDWTQAIDVPQAIKDKWAPYRQALRDVPQQAGFPESVVWPVKP